MLFSLGSMTMYSPELLILQIIMKDFKCCRKKLVMTKDWLKAVTVLLKEIVQCLQAIKAKILRLL